MPTISDFGNFRIYMYFKDENPPHIHIIGSDFEAKMRLDDCSVYAGKVSGKIERQAANYVVNHRATLWEKWSEYSGD